MQTANSMLTKGSPQTRHHPWTRVSWISGSDVDSLDEEEVQEVESITFGRALDDSPTNNKAKTSVVSPGKEAPPEEDAAKAAAVTLKPFSFEGAEESTGGSVLAPFMFNGDRPSVNFAANDANNSAPSSDKGDISQKGHLITPAVTDAVLEEPEEIQEVLPKKTCVSWKSFWGNGANTEPVQDKTPEEEDKINAEDTTLEEMGAVNVVEEDIIEDDDEEEEPAGIWATLSQRLQAERATNCLVSARERAKGCCVWIVDGLVSLWFKWISFGILIHSYAQNKVQAVKDCVCQNSAAISNAWEASSLEVVRIGALWALGGLFGLFLALAANSLISQRGPSPTNDLRDFVLFEKAHNVVDLKEIDELNTEAFRTYARSTCVQAETLEQARTALMVGLQGVPDGVRDNILTMAISEGVTQKNSVQDSNSDFVQSGKADAFMAFWSTVYDPSNPPETYKSCVMVTGVALTVAETIAEWTTKQEKYQIGSEPCHCGYVYCEECPIFDVREVKWPVFERRSLSLRKQEELRRWMVEQAVRSAEHLVLDGSDKNNKLGGGSSSDLVPSTSFAWTGQTSAAFFGEASHKDRVAPGGNVYATAEL